VPLHKTLAICKAAAQNDDEYVKCAAGAYNGMSYGEYKKVLDPKDPFKICRQISDADVPSECYANLASVVFNFTKDKTIQEAIDLSSAYTPPAYLLRAIPTFADMAARKLDPKNEFTCLSLATAQQMPCMGGFVSGLVQLELPDTKEKSAFALCSGGQMPQAYRTTCFGYALQVLAQFWTPDRVSHVCALAPPGGVEACHAALVP
jgi:hypothetical protein